MCKYKTDVVEMNFFGKKYIDILYEKVGLENKSM